MKRGLFIEEETARADLGGAPDLEVHQVEVRAQRRALRELAPARRALEGLLARVRAHVVRQHALALRKRRNVTSARPPGLGGK